MILPRFPGPGAALAALALFAAAPAVAQSPQGSPQGMTGPVRSGDFLINDGTLLRASAVIGAKVIGLDHHTLGSIDEVLVGRDGRVEAVVMGTGGVLGMGGRRVALPFDRFLWNTEGATRSMGRVASVSPDTAPSDRVAEGLRPERMPGAEVRDQALVSESDPNRARADSGPVSTGSTERATVIASEDGRINRAELRLTKADIDAAPEFKGSEGK